MAFRRRERVIAVSIRKDLHERFEFPSPVPLKFSFYDALEEYPDSRYFLSNEMYKFCIERDQYCKSHNLGYRFTPVVRERELQDSENYYNKRRTKN